MKPTLANAVAAFGALAREKLANPAAEGRPEDQLRAPLEGLVKDLAEAGGLPREKVVPIGEATLSLQCRYVGNQRLGSCSACRVVQSFWKERQLLRK